MYFSTKLVIITTFLIASSSVNGVLAAAKTEPLIHQITTLVNQYSKKGLKRTVVILTPKKELQSLCSNPKLAMTGSNNRLGGLRTVSALCDGKRKFIQIDVQTNAKWWVAKRPLKPNTIIQRDDIDVETGSASHLSTDVILTETPITGLMVTHMIKAGQPLRESQLRQRWRVMKNQMVDLEVSGDSFQIRSRGKAMNNAGLGETIRVETASGHIVEGTVIADSRAGVKIKK